MTALKGKDIKAFIARRDTAIPAVLIYGDDAGAVREYSDTLARQVIEDLTDPFNFIELSEADLKGEAGKLADEAVALSFMGGERVIRIRGAGEPVMAACRILITGLENGSLKPNALVLVEAGRLAKSSGLRKLFEKTSKAAALPCYQDKAIDSRQMVQEMLAAEGLTIEEPALSLVLSGFSADRALNRSEIEKLILYCGPKSVRAASDPSLITLKDVETSLAINGTDAMMSLSPLIVGGNPKALAAQLASARAAGASALGWLRLAERSFLRLYRARTYMDTGLGAKAAMGKLRPPVFYPETIEFEKNLQKWTSSALSTALQMLMETELEAKTTGAPAEELAERTALRLSVMAARR